MTSVEFISNAGDKLGSYIQEMVKWGEEIDIAVAYVKNSGYNSIDGLLGVKKIRILVGFDFWLTDTEPLYKILGKGYQCKVYRTPISNEEKGYHPKIYIARKYNEVRVVVGSSNLTHGGLYSNVESNVVLSGDKLQPDIKAILNFFNDKWNSSLSATITSGLIKQYASLKKEFDAQTKKISSEASFLTKKDKISMKGNSLIICMTKEHDKGDIYNRLVGVPIGTKKMALENIKEGTRFFIYYIGQGIVKVVQALDTSYIDQSVVDEWKDGLPETYPVRVKTKLLHTYPSAIKLGKLQKMGVCRADTGHILVGYHLQTSLVPITDNDGDMIENELGKV